MGYPREVYEQALRTLEGRRASAAASAAALRERATAREPRVAAVERELAATSLSLVRAVLAPAQTEADVAAVVGRIREQNLVLQAELARLLERQGERAHSFEPQYACRDCEDTGYVGARVCGCMERLLREYAVERLNRLGTGGAGMKLPLCRFEDFSLELYPAAREEDGLSPRERMTAVLTYCRRYAAEFSTASDSLLLRGPTGTGKTFLSLCIAREVTARGFQAVYGPLQLLLHRLEGEHFGREDGGSLDTMTGCDLLILDDLGVEFATPFYTSCLYTLLNTRQLAGLPTIISTNLGARQLQERYGDPISSRILGTMRPLLFAGGDIRLEARRQKLDARS